MNNPLLRLARWLFFGLALLAGLLVLFINRNLADLVGWFWPGSEGFTHVALLAVELLALLWFWRGVFGGGRHLLLMDGHSPEERQRFSRELVRRFRRNTLVRQAGIAPQGSGPEAEEDYVRQCLLLLNARADEEIRQNANRIFLATALIQNGRLDALLVFVSLCRLVWRVSRIYNQRPHPGEISSLYWAVASSTFLALSIEELDIPTEISVSFGEALHAVAPAGLTASIPFAGKALRAFTSSTIDGAANCYLALRAGIIVKNAYAYGALQQERPSRAAVFREAGAILLAMSQALVDRLAVAFAENLAGAARYAGGRTVQAGRGIVEGLGTSVGKVATEAASAVHSTGEGIVRLGAAAGGMLGNAAERAASGTVGAVRGTGEGIAKAGGKAATTLGTAADRTLAATRRVAGAPFRFLKRFSRTPQDN